MTFMDAKAVRMVEEAGCLPFDFFPCLDFAGSSEFIEFTDGRIH